MLATGDVAKVNYLFPSRSGAEFMPGGDVQPGSNAWAVSGAHTASKKALLANDMHLEFSIPGIWFMTHIEAPGMNVSGVALPGMPGVIVGHNDRIAWGVTNLHFDVQELYIEKMDLTQRPVCVSAANSEQATAGTRSDSRQGPASRWRSPTG